MDVHSYWRTTRVIWKIIFVDPIAGVQRFFAHWSLHRPVGFQVHFWIFLFLVIVYVSIDHFFRFLFILYSFIFPRGRLLSFFVMKKKWRCPWPLSLCGFFSGPGPRFEKQNIIIYLKQEVTAAAGVIFRWGKIMIARCFFKKNKKNNKKKKLNQFIATTWSWSV